MNHSTLQLHHIKRIRVEDVVASDSSVDTRWTTVTFIDENGETFGVTAFHKDSDGSFPELERVK